jgi:hypothetical protein
MLWAIVVFVKEQVLCYTEHIHKQAKFVTLLKNVIIH